MLGAKYGFAQSMDCTAQTMDPYFARQSMDCTCIPWIARAKYGSMVCAAQSMDCANPYFAPNIYIYTCIFGGVCRSVNVLLKLMFLHLYKYPPDVIFLMQ